MSNGKKAKYTGKLPVNWVELEFALAAPFESLEKLGVRKGGSQDRRHIFIDRGGSVLAIAHADSVQKYDGYLAADGVLRSATIDNRLGLWVAVYLLPRIGIRTDVLITDNEEKAKSTSRYFEPSRQYNWIVQFDRMGSDVVLYKHDVPSWRTMLSNYGFKVGNGSYSCLSDADCGCRGMNIGCGMQDYHGRNAYAELKDLAYNIGCLSKFYKDQRGTLYSAPKSERFQNKFWDRGYADRPGDKECSICKKLLFYKDLRWDRELHTWVCHSCYDMIGENGTDRSYEITQYHLACSKCGQIMRLSQLTSVGQKYFCDDCLEEVFDY